MVVNRGLRVRRDVSLNELLHHVFAEDSLNVVKELEAFLVRDFGEAVVREISGSEVIELASKLRMQGRVVAVEAVTQHIVGHRDVAEVGSFQAHIIGSVDLGGDFTLLKDGEALIEPHVRPVLACDVITSPGVGDLVRSHIDLRLI